MGGDVDTAPENEDSDISIDETKEQIVLLSPEEAMKKTHLPQEVDLSEIISPQSTCAASGSGSSPDVDDDLPPMDDDDETPSFGRGRRLGPCSSRPGPGLHRPPVAPFSSRDRSAKSRQRRPRSAALRRAVVVADR